MLSLLVPVLIFIFVSPQESRNTYTYKIHVCVSIGKHKARPCRMVAVEPPGKHVDDGGCSAATSRVAATGHDHPDKMHYAVKVDFRRCFEQQQSASDHKPRPVTVLDVVHEEEASGVRRR